MTLLKCRGYMSVVVALGAAAEADGTTDEEADLAFLSLHVFPLEDVDGLAPPVLVGVAVEDAVVVAFPEVEVPPFTNAAMGGPGKMYGALASNTWGSKIPGSLSLYAPGKLTNSESSGTPVPDPPTVSCPQAG